MRLSWLELLQRTNWRRVISAPFWMLGLVIGAVAAAWFVIAWFIDNDGREIE
jgi:hypothetical protein